MEISDAQHRALTMLAQGRGVRGFSTLVQEALDMYLQDVGDDEIAVLLQLEGSIDDAEESELREAMERSRSTWRASS